MAQILSNISVSWLFKSSYSHGIFWEFWLAVNYPKVNPQATYIELYHGASVSSGGTKVKVD